MTKHEVKVLHAPVSELECYLIPEVVKLLDNGWSLAGPATIAETPGFETYFAFTLVKGGDAE